MSFDRARAREIVESIAFHAEDHYRAKRRDPVDFAAYVDQLAECCRPDPQ
jgi:hypothetical protein